MTPDQPPVAAATVSTHIQRAGYAIADVGSLDDFVATCAALGEVLSLQDVALIPRSARHVNNPAAVPLHCDGPEADVVAWYCVRQDEHDGASILLDTRPILRSLSPALRQQLSSVGLPYFDRLSPSRPKGYVPLLLGTDEGTWRVNYAPWLLPEPLEGEQRDAVAAFREALAAAAAIRTRLHAGQCLFVDNWRVLHGRDPLNAASARLLKRAWVRTDRARREGSPGSGVC